MSVAPQSNPARGIVRDLGHMAYRPAFDVQRQVVEEVIGGAPDTLLLVEHDPVLTLGAGFHPENLLLTPEQYAKKGIEVVPTDRGGDVTFHGLNQLVAYPIFDLSRHGRDLHRWLRDLEEAVIVTLDQFGLKGYRFPPHTGVWVNEKKICAIGIKVQRWVSMHGIALNCNNDLAPFDTIVPCGIEGYGVTSISEELKRDASIDVAKPKPGETLLVSGAAGAVGSAVGQIGKILGCRVIGIAGGPDKCRRLIEDYGFDVAIDYKGKSVAQLAAEIREAAPGGADVIFENVGGDVFDAELLNLAKHARIVLCGLISEYNSPEKIGARNIWSILTQQATLYGYLIMDYAPRFAEGGAVMAEWMAQGRLRIDEDIQTGLENAYDAFMRLFTGANTGKLVLKIADGL